MFEDLDGLARRLAENDISRRQAIKWAGYSALGATLSTLGFADTAEALSRRRRRRCRRNGGTPLEKGNCHCGFKCGVDTSKFVCRNNINCLCTQTTEGRGFCADINTPCFEAQQCSSSSECPRGWKCARACCDTPICYPPCPPA